ncbi:hypothetical protein GCM10028796_46820 [Ramlibacter monticola]|uniref:Large polyvalent protein associated domain-containing protein n=1 Tax=Ramlibacter monticola TaxID=1926872 RepID=A0A937CX86_9BURK|nr:hypothetical protein [Ramlibacter monticola]MBL0394307.1 hypothetical protein [Ramlibacter monticola]
MAKLSDLIRQFGRESLGYLDTAATIGGNMAWQPVSGLAGLAQLARTGSLDEAVDTINRSNALAAPRTAEGALNVEKIGQAIDLLIDPLKRATDVVGEESPLAGAALAAIGNVVDPAKGAGRAARGAKRAAKAAEEVVAALPSKVPAKAAAEPAKVPVMAGGEDPVASSLKKNAKAPRKAREEPVEQMVEEVEPDTPRVNRDAPYAYEGGVLPPINDRVKPKVTARGPDLGTPAGDAAFRAKYGREPLYAMDEATRVKHFGDAWKESPEVWMSDPVTRETLMIPGGLEGDLTLADSAKISAQGIDYNRLNKKLAQAIHEKLVRSVDPGPDMPDIERFGRLKFGITSGNAPITKNLIEYAQMRPRSTAEISDWARYSPVGYDQKLPKDYKNEMNRAINEAYGVQASARGGTGTANTANRQYVSDLAKMYEEDPSFFVKKATETEPQFVERLMNQVRGLGPKTGSLGFAMLDPQNTNISAIDRHIADITRSAVSKDPLTAPIYDRRMLDALNAELNKSAEAKTLPTARKRVDERVATMTAKQKQKLGGTAQEIEANKFRDIVSTPESFTYRTKPPAGFVQGPYSQLVNREVPPHLLGLPFYEPKQAQVIGPLYEAALRNIQAGGNKLGLGGFSAQWFPWDYQRSRAEPHAALNKLAGTSPRLTPEEYAMARDTFAQAGGFNTRKDPATGRLTPFKPNLENWRKYQYGQATPALLGGTALATGAGLAAANDEDVQDLLRRMFGGQQ